MRRPEGLPLAEKTYLLAGFLITLWFLCLCIYICMYVTPEKGRSSGTQVGFRVSAVGCEVSTALEELQQVGGNENERPEKRVREAN